MMAYLTGSSDLFESRRSLDSYWKFSNIPIEREKGLCLIEQQSSWPFAALP